MLNAQQIISILEELEGDEEEFMSILDRVIKTGLEVQRNSEELLEECRRLFKNRDSVFQFVASDIDLCFFLKVLDGAMSYEQGISKEQDIPIVLIKFPKEIILRVISQEVSIESLYNKGIIKLQGSFSNLMRLRALGKYYMQYWDNTLL